MDTKQVLRQKMLALRKAQMPESVAAKSEALFDRLKGLLPEGLTSVAMYASLPSEVQTKNIYHCLKQRYPGAPIYFPRVEASSLKFYAVEDWASLHTSSFGVLEPKGAPDSPQPAPERSLHIMPNISLDLLFVPGVAFSKKGQRLGFGKGHYDRALADLAQKGARPRQIIGLAFEFQVLDSLPTEVTDHPIDIIITELNTYSIKSS